eukprot:2575957-Alexandrium_andersonii.AAC.1
MRGEGLPGPPRLLSHGHRLQHPRLEEAPARCCTTRRQPTSQQRQLVLVNAMCETLDIPRVERVQVSRWHLLDPPASAEADKRARHGVRNAQLPPCPKDPFQ